MYVTRPRSVYHHFPGALSLQPQADVAYSGHLVVTDEESEAMDSFCCGIWRNHKINRLPFPSDRVLQVVHSSLQEEAGVIKAWFVPVLDQPLSSNRYYVIKAKGRRKGPTHVREREMSGCAVVGVLVWSRKQGLLIIGIGTSSWRLGHFMVVVFVLDQWNGMVTLLLF
ncbi:uncharacterized protein LOC121770059 [Salvia splendens]|uniref:uncharacterized protein LOC121770059 n=1 Tax=Salvia splendens TaxID=180675 RepID=UPI001C25A976|nr:uncharacterized protein LOC121770059 [Salvia splendens]